MNECRHRLTANHNEITKVSTTLRQTQCQKRALTDLYADIFAHFRDIKHRERALKEKRKDSETVHHALGAKSDQLVEVADQTLQCIAQHRQSQSKWDRQHTVLQRYFGSKWSQCTRDWRQWRRSDSFIWFKYKMEWFNDCSKDQQRMQLELQHTMIKYNLSGNNLQHLPRYLGTASKWKLQIARHVKGLVVETTYHDSDHVADKEQDEIGGGEVESFHHAANPQQ